MRLNLHNNFRRRVFVDQKQIEEAMLAQQKDLLLQVVPQNYFDNDFVQSDLVPQTEQLQGIQKIYFARKAGQLTAYAYETTAPDGYSGNIRMLVGLTPAGEVLGVRVIEHHETPGLGDKIELRISNWILSFSNKWLKPDNLNDWAVKKTAVNLINFLEPPLHHVRW
ncbi:electron transport complex protein RnfG [Haemophilus pittmaniae HK 85]|uniref:Electron transport complex protein RnfG n=1 Tax=Haemophilus pittmaniae HK 85 TaxID=1035188 RepID=F9QC78_9PAST|nr:electron transport complex protein RnfG [Haemophilus pittmaniae HK 85]